MPCIYYLGTAQDGTAVARESRQDYGYTHAAGPNAYGKWNFSTSADGAIKNARTDGGKAPEVVQVSKVDRKTFMAATGRQPSSKCDPIYAPSALPVPAGPFETREAWLMGFTEAVRPMFLEVGAPLPDKVRVSVGFPSKGNRSKVIGECWASQASDDGVCEVFLTPGLQADPARVADVLTHELIHAALGHEEGHGPNFRRTMKRLGLEGKATATTAGDAWRSWALPVVEALGPFPGAGLNSLVLAGGKKTQTTRYLKVVCTMCEWTARVTAKHLDHGALNCPVRDCEGELVRADNGEGGE